MEAAEQIIEAAVEAAKSRAANCVLADDLTVVVNVAWTAPNGNTFAFGSAIPDGPLPALLADSLRRSAAEVAQEVGNGG
jgi:hypothetical protein